MTLKAVVFDLDGVITDTANLHFLAWRAVVRRHSGLCRYADSGWGAASFAQVAGPLAKTGIPAALAKCNAALHL